MDKRVYALNDLVNELLESLEGYGVDDDTLKYFEKKQSDIFKEK